MYGTYGLDPLGALVYFTAVFDYGDDAFRGAQQKCDPPSRRKPPGGEGDGNSGGEGGGDSANSIDPNEKLGPGYGPEGWVTADALLPYRINFENLGPGSVDVNGDPYETFATAPAQRVTITDELEDSLDWSTFRITEFGFGDTVVHVPADTSHHTETVFTSYNGKTFRVAFEAGIDYQTGEITVVFQSLEPDIDLPPDILTGFLPPEDGTGRGMGHFSYTIRTKADLPSETQIRNVAVIKFDINETISTDQVDPQDPSQGIDPDRQALVTLDGDAPEATIAVLDETSNNETFTVNWEGNDEGSGIRDYDVYVSVDGGVWELWLSATAETSAEFEGVAGRSYRFSAVARDNAGNTGLFDGNSQGTVSIVRAIYQPDLAIGSKASSLTGVGIIGETQQISLTSKKAKKIKGFLSVSNIGNTAESFLVSGPKGSKFFDVRYLGPTGNATATMLTGRHRTGLLRSEDGTEAYRILVKPTKKLLKRSTPKGVRYARKKAILQFRGASSIGGTSDSAVMRVQLK
ncbi:MAG: hypothetical protein AAGC68_16865 [Verrucomicrobiota bacterium]